jgi:hypothetical protein
MNAAQKTLSAVFAALAIGAGTAVAQEELEELPLDGVIADMQVAGGRLARFFTDKPTQQKQQDAVDKLDALIKVLEQQRQRQQGRGRASANPEEPLQDSIIKEGPGGSGPLHSADRQGKAWGQLPPHKREQILQSMTEGFPPHYQQLLERYYRRLAEERPADDTAGDAEPAAAPDSNTEQAAPAP